MIGFHRRLGTNRTNRVLGCMCVCVGETTRCRKHCWHVDKYEHDQCISKMMKLVKNGICVPTYYEDQECFKVASHARLRTHGAAWLVRLERGG